MTLLDTPLLPPMLPPPAQDGDHSLEIETTAETVRACLVRTGYLDLRFLSIETTGSLVVLRGQVSSFYLKQVAQAAVGDVEGVRLVVNRIEVERPSPRPAREAPARAERNSAALSVN